MPMIFIFDKELFLICFIGIFEIDLGTVYKQPDNEFYHKWGAIMSADDKPISTGSSSACTIPSAPKGYVKLDIIVLSKGDSAQIHKEELEKDDDIDK